MTQAGQMAAERKVRPCRVILVGMMGSGKTTIGRLLSGLTGWPYHDNDALLLDHVRLTARQVLARDGEGGLRAAEAAALRAGVGRPPPCIVGTAAGTITAAPARRLLRRSGFVVWLRATPRTLAGRAAGGWHRPWLDADAVAWLAARLTEREALYHQAADLVVDVDHAAPPEIVRRIDTAARAALDCPD